VKPDDAEFVEPIPPARDEDETPRKHVRQKLELSAALKRMPNDENSQKSNRSGMRNNETTIQLEEDGLLEDMNRIVISSSNVITFNQDDDGSLASGDESPEAEKSDGDMFD
jgi:hypothetical protein